MAGTKQEDGKLNFNWGLGDIGVVIEDDLVGNAIKGSRVNTYPSPVLIKVSSAPIFKKVKLQCFFDCWVLAKNP